MSRGVLDGWRPDSYPEYVGSLPLGALAAVLLARWTTGRWPADSGAWRGLLVVGVLLSLGPFITVAGVNTHVPGPWSVLRFTPVLGWARAPSRFAVLSTLGLSVLLAFALRDLAAVRPVGRRLAGAAIVWLLIESVSMPRPVFAASMPSVFDVIAANRDSRERVLFLPVGVRDGLESLGNALPIAQFYQTRHGKAMIGGYLSRVSSKRRHATWSIPTLRALMTLSAGEALSDTNDIDGRVMARRFVTRGRIGFVVIDSARTSTTLRAWAVDALELEPVAADQGFELFRPRAHIEAGTSTTTASLPAAILPTNR